MGMEKLRDDDLRLAELLEQARQQALEYKGRIAELEATIEAAQRLVEQRNNNLLTARNPLLEGTTPEEEDTLTGLPAQPALERALERLYASKELFSVVTFEVDHFSDLEKRFGANVSGEVLRRIAGLVRKVLRASDVPGRSGDSTYTLLLRGITGDRTFGVCERLRLAVLKYPWENLSPGLTVTVSLGFAGHDPQSDIHDVIERADRYQEEAKSCGRNQTFPGLYY